MANGNINPAISNSTGPATTVGNNTGAPAANGKTKSILTNPWVWLAVAVAIIAITLAVIYSKKRPAAAEEAAAVTAPDVATAPGDIDPKSITTAPVEDKPAATGKYQSKPTEPGMIISFKTPNSTGVRNDSTFLGYLINIRDSSPTGANATKNYILPAITQFTAGKADNVAPLGFMWDDVNNGVEAGTTATLFIKRAALASFVQDDANKTPFTSYTIGIKAINKANISSENETISAPISHDACKAEGACNWTSDTVAGPATIVSEPEPLAAAGVATAETVIDKSDGAQCTIPNPAPYTFYKYEGGNCIAKGCVDKTYAIINNVCIKQAAEGEFCTQDGKTSAVPTLYKYYANKNPAKAGQLICDLVSNPKSTEIASCLEAKKITSLPLNTIFSKNQPLCEISCVSDNFKQVNPANIMDRGCAAKTCPADKPTPNATAYTAYPECKPTACTPDYKPEMGWAGPSCLPKQCSFDMDTPISGIGTWVGEWGSCNPRCSKEGAWGTDCTSTVTGLTLYGSQDFLPTGTAVTSLLYGGGNATAPPVYYVTAQGGGNFIFGKGVIDKKVGLYKVDGASSLSTRIWDIGTGLFKVENTGLANVILGTKTFVPTGIPAPSTSPQISTTTILTSLKSFRVTSNGNLYIKYTNPSAAFSGSFRLMSITPEMMAPTAAAVQYLPTSTA
jgi:hypothetical protein